MTSIKRFYVLLVGYEMVPKSLSLRGGDSRIMIAEPICCYLVDTDTGWILMDTGLDESRLRDPELAKQFYMSRGWSALPVVRPTHSLLDQLNAIGVQPADVTRVFLSHMEADHTGYLKLFRHAKVYVQRAEYIFATETPPFLGNITEDYDFPDIDWQLLDGDAELVPGLQIISTPGHTPGHQSAVATLPSGTRLVLTFDAGDFLENFEQEQLPGSASGGDEAALASIRRLNELAKQSGSMLFPFHDPVFIQGVKLAPLYYE
ncbi:N-acyl homoserine lactonase family protein [Paenibacillus sp. Leaf72]|uniref:N-acyl homoserine lactonase family protein n=1 Tax=Paenibacillus sp. Leaf72 TaxID=1736234 RepID=UPI0006F46EE7|nr:N-acyl homoserine lactonase family protein [Paenibacillus sp. Leaf72]KQN99986.1 hypothetical protein ASF12_17570 [Paenibacillus sp. Leaf72]